MTNLRIPFFCKACIERSQHRCPHLHTSSFGGFHYVEGEVWDDIVEICDDCGAELDSQLRVTRQPTETTDDIPF